MVVYFNFLRVASSCPRTLEIYDVSSITVYRVYTQYPYLSQMYHATTYVLDRTAQVTQPLIYHDLNLMHRPLLPAPTQTWQLSVWATNGWCLVPKYGMYCVNIPPSPQTLCLTISGRRTRFNFLFFTLDNMCQSEMPQAISTDWQPMNLGRICIVLSGARIFLPVIYSPGDFLPVESNERDAINPVLHYTTRCGMSRQSKFLQPSLWQRTRELTLSWGRTEDVNCFYSR